MTPDVEAAVVVVVVGRAPEVEEEDVEVGVSVSVEGRAPDVSEQDLEAF